jgi:hypothetical protein
VRCEPTYEVVTDSVTLPNSAQQFYEFRLTAPAGKKPVAGGWNATQPETSSNTTGPQTFGTYPDGQDWVFRFSPATVSGGFNLVLYLICAEV